MAEIQMGKYSYYKLRKNHHHVKPINGKHAQFLCFSANFNLHLESLCDKFLLGSQQSDDATHFVEKGHNYERIKETRTVQTEHDGTQQYSTEQYSKPMQKLLK